MLRIEYDGLCRLELNFGVCLAYHKASHSTKFSVKLISLSLSARLQNSILYPNAVPSNSAQPPTTGNPLVPYAPRFVIPLQHPLVFRERCPVPDSGDW
jgi:energy-converting hydrogenase Eha subunit F